MDFSTDVLVEILQRLPPSARRRARLVCKLWREAIYERTTEMRSRANPLLWNDRSAIAYVIGDVSPSSTQSCSELWRSSRPYMYVHYEADLQLVSTCNGLLCLCDCETGDVTLVNPVTGETLSIPPFPYNDKFFGCHDRRRWERAYSFAYHPTSGRYKLVHVPCSFQEVFGFYEACDFDALQVLTLGDEASWREVSASIDTRCNLDAGIISIDGSTYWVTEGSVPRVVFLSLDDESVFDFAMPLPALWVRPGNYRLTEVWGRLGFVVYKSSELIIGVWVLEEKGLWTRRYSLDDHWEHLARLHFVHGEYVITHDRSSFYGHHRRKCDRSLSRDVMKVSYKDQGTLIANMLGEAHFYRMFAYVQTTEPLGVYAAKV